MQEKKFDVISFALKLSGEDLDYDNFTSRQIFALKASFLATFYINLLFGLSSFFTPPARFWLNLIAILSSSLPTYYFLKKRNIAYAQFFVYFPALFAHSAIAFEDFSLGIFYGNIELVLIPSIAVGIILFEGWVSFAAISINILLFLIIKYVRYSLSDITVFEMSEDFFAGLIGYVVIIFLSIFYRQDFKILKESNDKLNEQKLIIQNQSDTLKIANEAKNKLFGIIAHDVRSPIASLKAVLGLLNDKSLSQEEFRELSVHLQKNVDKVSEMLDNLLVWSLSQMDRIRPNFRAVLISDLLEDNLLLFNNTINDRNVVFMNGAPNETYLWIDEHQINTVIRNLLNNSIKFTPLNGKIEVKTIVIENDLLIVFSDSGIGIKEEELVHIFSKPQINRGISGEKGTGLGLFLCKELVEKNNGSISISSIFGQGTSVEVLLPIFKKNYMS